MKGFAVGCSLALVASAALGADAESGRRLAQLRCAACHIVTASPRNDLVADAPPFLAIARKYGSDTDSLVFNLVGPHAKMNFALSRPDRVTVRVYDVSGRLVRTLADRNFDAGPQSLTWDGSDDGGRQVQRGVYFTQVKYARTRFTDAKKLTVLK